jgi:hypothetical protein
MENNIRMIFWGQGGKMWTGCMWLRIGTSGGGVENTVMNLRLT